MGAVRGIAHPFVDGTSVEEIVSGGLAQGLLAEQRSIPDPLRMSHSRHASLLRGYNSSSTRRWWQYQQRYLGDSVFPFTSPARTAPCSD